MFYINGNGQWRMISVNGDTLPDASYLHTVAGERLPEAQERICRAASLYRMPIKLGAKTPEEAKAILLEEKEKAAFLKEK